MNYSLEELSLYGLRKIYSKLRKRQIELPDRECNPDKASEIIFKAIMSGKPFMASRFGAVEIGAVYNYCGVKSSSHNFWKFIKGQEPEWWWNEGNRYCMKYNAGFFPNDNNHLSRFGELMLSIMRDIDILMSWQQDESFFSEYLKKAIKLGFIFVDPYWSERPWTRALRDKNVLVIHPFADEIQYQYYNKREQLFENPEVLPKFNLRTIKAVQSIGGNSKFSDWFEALDYMENEIDSIEYDICLLGCGAYGMPLAAHVKKQGKQAVHFGGSLQLLFGIRGRRWETREYGADFFPDGIGRYPDLMNQFWIRPFKESKFNGAEKVENGCYW